MSANTVGIVIQLYFNWIVISKFDKSIFVILPLRFFNFLSKQITTIIKTLFSLILSGLLYLFLLNMILHLHLLSMLLHLYLVILVLLFISLCWTHLHLLRLFVLLFISLCWTHLHLVYFWYGTLSFGFLRFLRICLLFRLTLNNILYWLIPQLLRLHNR